jgi:hypothetical protein
MKLLFPALRPFYDKLEPLSWLLIRCAVGLTLAVHGWGKIVNGAEKMAPAFMKMGYEHPVWWRGGGPYSLDRVIGREL